MKILQPTSNLFHAQPGQGQAATAAIPRHHRRPGLAAGRHWAVLLLGFWALALAPRIMLTAFGQTTATSTSIDFKQDPGTELDGVANPEDGSLWDAVGPAGPKITVAAGNLAVPGLPEPEGNLARVAGVAGPASRLSLAHFINAADGYYSMALRVSDLGTLGPGGGTLAAFNDATGPGTQLPTALVARLLVRSRPGGFQLGISKRSIDPGDFVWAPQILTGDDVVFVVVRYAFNPGEGDDKVSLWVNPGPETFGLEEEAEGAVTTSTGPDIGRIASFVLMQRPAPALPAVTQVDELRIGTAWPAMCPPWMDFADAPQPPYPTMLPVGARHLVGPLRFGMLLDAEPNGQPVDLDDAIGVADEGPDGVFFPSGGLMPGAVVNVDIAASLPGYVDLWIDMDGMPGWSPAEQVLTAAFHPGGGILLPFPVAIPPGATPGMTWARARLSNNPVGLPPGGFGGFGEVADFQVSILPPPTIDLGVVVVGDPVIHIEEDTSFTLSLSVSNNGSSSATSVQLSATLPAEVDLLSVLSQDGQPANDACQITGQTLNCQIASLEPGQNHLFSLAIRAAGEDLPGEESANLGDLAVTVSATEADANLADNDLTVSIFFLFAKDWADAPVGFPVTKAENGARARRKTGFKLGVDWDREANGTHSANADYDDLHGATPDDEESITFTAPVAPGAPAVVTVQASAAGYLDAWIDFNGDLDWADAGEQIFASQTLAAGANTLTFTVPTSATAGTVFSRWRLSETGGLSYYGYGGKGEVEDHPVTISRRLDLGDAPEWIPGIPPILTTYEVTLARDGGRHDKSTLRLGAEWDSEIDGQPSTGADLDDLTGPAPDDEDGWTPVTFVPGTMMNITVYVSGGNGLLDLWVDWDQNYNWDAPEHSVVAWPVVPGANVVPVNVPGGIPNGQTYARFRLSTTGSALPSGYAPDGEVEDYLVDVDAKGGGNGENPNPVDYAGVPHTALGQAVLSVTPSGLQVANIGSSGLDGVAIELSDLTRSALVGLSPVDLRSSGCEFRLAAYGTVDGLSSTPLGRVRFENDQGLIHGFFILELPLIGQSARVEVYNGAALAGSFAIPSSGQLGSFSDNFRIAAAGVSLGQMGQMSFLIQAAEAFNCRPPSGAESSAPVTGDRLKVVASGSAGEAYDLTGLVLTGKNLDMLTLVEESIPTSRPSLRIDRVGGRLILNWDTPHTTLQRAPTVRGPWMDVASGVTAYEVRPEHAKEFYRLVVDATFDLPHYRAKRNVLLIVADDVGVDQLPPYIRYHNDNVRTDDDITVDSSIPETLTPAIWKLATSGVTFVNAWSSPTCSPTRAGLFTGNCSFRHGVYSPGQPNLPSTSTTIAQVLQDAGYTSGLFGKWHLGDPSADPPGPSPMDFGWVHHDGIWGGHLPSYYEWIKVEDTQTNTVSGETHYATHENVNDTLDWIGAQNGPWMATVTFNAAHWADTGLSGNYYEMPPDDCPYRTRTDATNKEMFRSIVECMDRSITTLLDGIDPDELARTTIIFMGDNGTESDITDHFTVGHAKGSVYEGGVNVPLIVADGYAYLHDGQSPDLPFLYGTGRVVSPGRFEKAVVQTMDLFVTIAKIGGGSESSGQDSVSLLPYLHDPSAAAQRTMVFAEKHEPGWVEGGAGWTVALRDQSTNHKLIIKNYGSCSPSYELYDLSSDRWETVDLLDGALSWPVWMGSDFIAPLYDLLGVTAESCP